MSTILLELPSELLDAAHLDAAGLRVELAVHLYEQGRISFGKARELAGMDVERFQHLLGAREIPVHYDISDFEMDQIAIGRLASQ